MTCLYFHGACNDSTVPHCPLRPIDDPVYSDIAVT